MWNSFSTFLNFKAQLTANEVSSIQKLCISLVLSCLTYFCVAFFWVIFLLLFAIIAQPAWLSCCKYICRELLLRQHDSCLIHLLMVLFIILGLRHMNMPVICFWSFTYSNIISRQTRYCLENFLCITKWLSLCQFNCRPSYQYDRQFESFALAAPLVPHVVFDEDLQLVTCTHDLTFDSR